MPELGALRLQRLDEMRMAVAQRDHRDARAEIQIAFTRRRRQPATVATLEGDVGAGISRYDRGRHVLGCHQAAPSLSVTQGA